METKTYSVRGMSCGGCAASVTRAIQASDDTAEIEVDLGRALVMVKGTVSEDDVRNVVCPHVEDSAVDLLNLGRCCSQVELPRVGAFGCIRRIGARELGFERAIRRHMT